MTSKRLFLAEMSIKIFILLAIIFLIFVELIWVKLLFLAILLKLFILFLIIILIIIEMAFVQIVGTGVAEVDSHIAIVPKTTKYVLVASGSYPYNGAIMKDKAGKAFWVSAPDIPDQTKKGATVTIPTGSVISYYTDAWDTLRKTYAEPRFKNKGWESGAIKPYSNDDLKNTMKDIAKANPSLERFVLHYFGHGDEDANKRPFLSIRGRTKDVVSGVEYPSDSEVGGKYFIDDLVKDINDIFGNVKSMVLILDGCNLAINNTSKIQLGKAGLVASTVEDVITSEGLFTQHWAHLGDPPLNAGVFDDFAANVGDAVKAVNADLERDAKGGISPPGLPFGTKQTGGYRVN
jgi:hypothetical protein